MFSNKYRLIKKNSSDKFGVFMQLTSTDDFQKWFGQGVFSETKRKIHLQFDTTGNFNRIELDSTNNKSDTLCIKWFDWYGRKESFFKIRFTDTTQNNKIYYSSLKTSSIKIPLNELSSKNLTLLYPFKLIEIVSFTVPDGVSEVRIIASIDMHLIKKSTETLKKNKFGFVTRGVFSKKRCQFIPENKQAT